MPLDNQTLRFLNLLCLKSDSVSQCDFLHVDIERRSTTVDLKFFKLVMLKRLPANQILKFVNQLYLK